MNPGNLIADLISVIVPCYNEEESLPMFYEKTSEVLCSIENADYEFIFVDDGSTDRTVEYLKRMRKQDERCRYISFSRNFGKEAAMFAGLKEAKGDYCVIMDADLQHPPTLLPDMYRAVSVEGWDCCGGKRKGREGDGGLRAFFSRAFYRVSSRLTQMDMRDGQGDFRMMCRKMTDAIINTGEYNRYMKGIFCFVGFRTKWIEYENVERTCGSTKWSFKSLFKYAAEGIISFSSAPLKLPGFLGLTSIIAGLVFAMVNAIQLISGTGKVSGTELIICVVMLLAGVQLISIYIMGLYIYKDCLESKKRPVYIIRERG